MSNVRGRSLKKKSHQRTAQRKRWCLLCSFFSPNCCSFPNLVQLTVWLQLSAYPRARTQNIQMHICLQHRHPPLMEAEQKLQLGMLYKLGSYAAYLRMMIDPPAAQNRYQWHFISVNRAYLLWYLNESFCFKLSKLKLDMLCPILKEHKISYFEVTLRSTFLSYQSSPPCIPATFLNFRFTH